MERNSTNLYPEGAETLGNRNEQTILADRSLNPEVP